ncbi:CHAT domain-containing protein [Endozoicomonas ascidiicola]|uniref:CHAT domain-containing protein n=1 Tax=Endozoicomonas ascidiicola TaxID=1698521 RepID=UPI0012FA5FDB|nr:CHAT domain-containing protein [Endozoicomonas ascidiicola]
MSLVHQGDFVEAISRYQDLLAPEELDNDIDESHYRAWINALLLFGDKTQANTLLEQRTALLKKYQPEAEKRLLTITAASMFSKLLNGNPQGAIDDYVQLPTTIRREGPEAGNLFLLLGDASRQLNNVPNAEYAYQLALLNTGNHHSKVTILLHYAGLLYETRGSQKAIELLSQLDDFNPDVQPEVLPIYFNDRALAFAFYGRLLIDKAKANPTLRRDTATKALKLYEEAMKSLKKLPRTTMFQGTSLAVTLEAARAFEDMGYREQALALYELLDGFLGNQKPNNPLFARAFWEVKFRQSQLQKEDKSIQAHLAMSRVNAFTNTIPADSPLLFAPKAELAWKLIDIGETKTARNLLFNIFDTYNQHIDAFGTCDNGLDSLYANNLLKALTPSELVFIADEVLQRLLMANSQGRNIWQSRNCRMALYTIMDAMEKFQHLFPVESHPAERAKLDSINVLAAQLHRYSPMAHSLAIRKLKRDTQTLPYGSMINRLLSIGEEQHRLRVQLRDSMTTQGQSAQADELAKAIERLTEEHQLLLIKVQKQYPNAVIPTLPAPAHPASIMENLADDEAAILWAVDDYGSKAIVITKQRVQSVALPIDLADMDKLVNDIRLTLDQPDIRSPIDIRPFAMEPAFQLYKEVFAPLIPLLKDKQRLYLLPDGPLSKLPFQVLPMALPEKPVNSALDFINYRTVAWLGDQFQMNYQPSLNNLYDQLIAQKSGKTSASSHPLAYAGFGNPVMPNNEESAIVDQLFSSTSNRINKVRQSLQSSFNFMGDSALENLSRLAPLPKTEQQLHAIGEILGEDDYIYTGRAATLQQLEQLPLEKFETLVFATHGLTAGKDMPEPGLVMTPNGNDFTSAILDSSTIAGLNLNADRVVLSACNTAELGQDNGLASLSTAFFQAGAKSLLVSHWSTEQSATTELMVSVFQHIKQYPEQGLTPALRHAAQTMRDHDKNSFHAHPMFWAPFVAIGQDQ